jgi:thiol-disulfide isomerase/thioredoxin
MRAKHVPAICIVLACSCGYQVSAQTNPAPAPQESSTAGPRASAGVQQGDEGVSLAEAARRARANKAAATKPAKSYDDDNFVRSTPIVKKDAAEGAPANPSVQNLPSEEMHGKVVLLDFWASWCGPCRSALPKVKQLQSIYGGEEFMVVSVSEDNDETTWRGFVAEHQMSWAQRFDGNSSFMRQYQVQGLPTYVLLDRDGKEVQRYVGEDPGRSVIERMGPDIRRALQSSQSVSN